MARAASLAAASSKWRVAIVVLEKFMAKPVALAKLSSIPFKAAAASDEAGGTIRVSSAYCKTVGGR